MTPEVAIRSKRSPLAARSDEELLQACLQGSEQAWAALVDKYRNLVYSVPVKYRMPPEDAADVFQAVWTDLFAELPKLRNAGALKSWLITVTGHKCYQWKKLHALQVNPSESGVEPIDPQASFLEWKQDVEREQMLRDAIHELPSRCQEMVRLLFFEQPPLPYKVVGERLGLAEGSIGFIRGRCLQKLRTALEKMGF